MTELPVELPARLADAGRPYVGMECGRRSLSWAVLTAGVWHRAPYLHAWFEVREDRPWSDEPSVVSRRRVTDLGKRVSFPDGAGPKIAKEILAPIASYGFGRLWLELSQAAHAGADRGGLAAARRHVEWHELRVDLAEMHAGGLVDFRPLPPGGREVRKRVVADRQGVTTERVVAEAVVGVERVGWLTDRGELIPEDFVLSSWFPLSGPIV